MEVGDLVRYWHLGHNRIDVGIVIKVDHSRCQLQNPYKVRWSDHSDSERDWYREDELVKL